MKETKTKNVDKVTVADQIAYALPKLKGTLEIPFGDIVFSVRDGKCYKIMINRSFLYNKLEGKEE